ncbi:unnamed protein product, partial [marine sediment metagenome]
MVVTAIGWVSANWKMMLTVSTVAAGGGTFLHTQVERIEALEESQ